MIIDLEHLATICSELRKQNKSIVYCNGSFENLHIGHIRHLHQARLLGDYLVVSVLSDKFLSSHHKVSSINTRLETVSSLDSVNYVTVNDSSDATDILRIIKPDIYAVGSNVNENEINKNSSLENEKNVISEIGSKIVYTEDTNFSSTSLINTFLSTFSKEVQQYISIFKSRYSVDQVLEIVERMSELKILTIGDTIIDEYIYCETIGTSSKDPVLSIKQNSCDSFAGGVLAIANHMANFAKKVSLFSLIGDDGYESFIREKINTSITPILFKDKNRPTLIKRRFVEGYSLAKLFEVYIMDDSQLDSEMDKLMCMKMKEIVNSFDIVLAADFGHGAITDAMRSLLCDQNTFLAINTQANSGNRGFHTFVRYKRANFVSIAEHELRLEARNMTKKVKSLLEEAFAKIDSDTFIVTRGKQGCLVKHKSQSIIDIPAFAQKVVDRIGAGDAFLSIAAMASYVGAPPELIGFIGNVVGALAVGILGNQKAVSKECLTAYIKSLLR